ncbi:DUF4386 domain-containing protein [Pseudodonghicola flavimaris]|uniref:DUF4386 domain-containing protein n=1 Tax=Pseudodonghicola flavimaris TaxID=3050036 RepID=A0ABT7F5Q8_9RHOB|nr:DUF4386 domain-containing protein [Pseudodonghicola flavimaris]MDK3019739.1 DUF4386 domain-containing protein [Pseudodonghicola flavimaris]
MTAHSVSLAAARPLLRLAGLLYLVIILCGIGAEVAVRAPLIDPQAPTETARVIATALPLWRLGLAADLAMILADVAIAAVFLRLFATGFPVLAPMAFGLRLVQAAGIAAAVIPLALVPELTDHPIALLQALRLHDLGYDTALIFFGLNCLLMARMLWPLMRPFLPLAMAGAGAVYLTGSLAALTAPALAAALEPAYLLPLVAETGLCLWLITTGLRSPRAGQPEG